MPGTLAVMPSLLDNSPYAVAECIEHGFRSSRPTSAGLRSLIAAEDRPQVLFGPTADELAAALRERSRACRSPLDRHAPPEESLAAWLELVESVEPARPQPGRLPDRVFGGRLGNRQRLAGAAPRQVDRLGRRGFGRGSVAERGDSIRRTRTGCSSSTTTTCRRTASSMHSRPRRLHRAPMRSRAAVRPADDAVGLQLFLGNPGPLGLIENQYGVIGLVARADRPGLCGLAALCTPGAPPVSASSRSRSRWRCNLPSQTIADSGGRPRGARGIRGSLGGCPRAAAAVGRDARCRRCPSRT